MSKKGYYRTKFPILVYSQIESGLEPNKVFVLTSQKSHFHLYFRSRSRDRRNRSCSRSRDRSYRSRDRERRRSRSRSRSRHRSRSRNRSGDKSSKSQSDPRSNQSGDLFSQSHSNPGVKTPAQVWQDFQKVHGFIPPPDKFQRTEGFEQRSSYGQSNELFPSYSQRSGFQEVSGFEQRPNSESRSGFQVASGFEQRSNSESRTGFDQRHNFEPKASFDQRQNFEPRTSFDQRSSFEPRTTFGQGFDNRAGKEQRHEPKRDVDLRNREFSQSNISKNGKNFSATSGLGQRSRDDFKESMLNPWMGEALGASEKMKNFAEFSGNNKQFSSFNSNADDNVMEDNDWNNRGDFNSRREYLFGNSEERRNPVGFSGQSGFKQQQREFYQQEREFDQQGSRFGQQMHRGSSFQRFNNEQPDEDMTYDLMNKNRGKDIDALGSEGNGGFGNNVLKSDPKDDNNKEDSNLGPMFVIGQNNSNNAKSRRW